MKASFILPLAISICSCSCWAADYRALHVAFYTEGKQDEKAMTEALKHVSVTNLNIDTNDLDVVMRTIYEHVEGYKSEDLPLPNISAHVYKAKKWIRLKETKTSYAVAMDKLCSQLGASWHIGFGKGIFLTVMYPGDKVFGPAEVLDMLDALDRSLKSTEPDASANGDKPRR